MANLALFNSLRRNATSVPLSFLWRGEFPSSSVSAYNTNNNSVCAANLTCISQQPTRITSSYSDSLYKLQLKLAWIKRRRHYKSIRQRQFRNKNLQGWECARLNRGGCVDMPQGNKMENLGFERCGFFCQDVLHS